MDSLPSAPAPKTEEERAAGFGRSDFASRPDRAPLGQRDEVPLPTAPPYTAFVGNLAFDMTEGELEEYFGPHKTVSVKIISDRDGKPKGFGYVEFEDLEGLKNALVKSGGTLSHRTVRVNVADPPKERERGGFGGAPGGGGFDDEKFSGPWRRDGPLPASAAPERRGAGFGFKDRAGPADEEGARRGNRFQPVEERAELGSDWRASVRGPLPPLERERGGDREQREPKRGFGSNFESSGAADAEDTWAKGAKFKPAAPAETGSIGRRFGGGFERQGGAPGSGPGSGSVTPSVADESDWRSARPARPAARSPTSSTPPTPQLARRKLELLPRTGAPSNTGTPLASPSPTSAGPSSKASPFGAARPVDVTAREKEVEERLAKEREELARQPLSRETSRQATSRENPHALSRETSRQGSTRANPPMSRETSRQAAPRPAPSSVRPTFSFASVAKGRAEAAAAAKEENSTSSGDNAASQEETKDGQASTENVAEITDK
ncbi:hypothetical protein M422DRAFT_39603, partial [Sphaerobolus stellatus SS14]